MFQISFCVYLRVIFRWCGVFDGVMCFVWLCKEEMSLATLVYINVCVCV